MQPEDLAWPILLLPLGAAIIITLCTRRWPRLSAQISIMAVASAFVLSSFAAVSFAQMELSAKDLLISKFNWISLGDLTIDFGLRYDSLSALMLLVVTGVGGTIHFYSYGYMREDRGFSRYFACLSLFTFSMTGLVLANNFVLLFIFWELVGLSSYLLIGFWFERAAAADAAKKAFLTNRLGDFGFLIGILLIWGTLGHLDFDILEAKLQSHRALGGLSTIAGLLIFCGAMGKSAQFPLHVWLPDAMEGPTPVSALIHAATMVAAGVYMLCRVFFLYNAAPLWPESLAFLPSVSALDVIGWIGGVTALLAAVIAVQQNDIKRILAYSTLSQLGYMVMAIGVHGPVPAMSHLVNHAFFKALLFLAAGSVILALHHEQDIWKMGGLRRQMPLTFWTFLIGTLALCGVPPFSGFFSKDEILAATLNPEHRNIGLFVIGVVVALLTTFYMFRLIFVAFLGPAKSAHPLHAHESLPIITIPLILLALPSALAGFFGIPNFYASRFGSEAVLTRLAWHQQIFAPFSEAPLAAFLGILAVMAGFSAALHLYRGAVRDPLPGYLHGLSRAMRNRFYFDEIYDHFVVGLHEILARFVDSFDRWIIGGLCVRGAHGTTEIVGRALRLAQTGNLRTYALLFAAGAALVLYFAIGSS